MAVDATSLYWLDNETFHVQKVSKSGGSSTMNVTPPGAQTVTSFVIDATSIGVTDSIAGLLVGGDLQGQNSFLIGPVEPNPTALGWEPGHAYWISHPSGSDPIIRRVAR